MLEQFVVSIKNLMTQEVVEYQMTKAQYLHKMQELKAKESLAVHPINGWPVYEHKQFDVTIDIACLA